MKQDSIGDLLNLAGRVLLAVLFLTSALGKLAGFAGVAQVLAAKGLPAPALFAGAAIALEIVGSLALVLGWQVRWAALALGAFTVIAGVLFHNFWNAPEAMAAVQRQAFFKNVGLLGGLFVLAAHGPGRLRLGARSATASSPLYSEKA